MKFIVVCFSFLELIRICYMHHTRQAVIFCSRAGIAYKIIPIENILYSQLYRTALVELIAGDEVDRQQIAPVASPIRHEHTCQCSIKSVIMIFDAGIILLASEFTLPHACFVLPQGIAIVRTKGIAVLAAKILFIGHFYAFIFEGHIASIIRLL